METDLTRPIKRLRFKIIHFMIVSAFLALIFAILRTKFRQWAGLGPGIFAIYILCIASWVIYGALKNNALQALLAHPPENEDEFIDRLEKELATNAPQSLTTTAIARFRLMQLYKVRKQYAMAIEHGRTIIKFRGLTHASESKVHLELAICLDFLGQGADAEAHRRAADDCLDNRPEDALGWMVQGELYDKQKRFAEAAGAYERALDSYPSEDKAVHDQLLVRLTLSTFNAGRPDESIKWAQRAIAGPVRPELLYTAHRMAGVAASNLARLDESHYHRQRTYELALDGGDSKKISDCLASLADIRRLRGDLDQAWSLCQQAETLSPESSRQAVLVQAMILRARGRSGEAAQRMEQALSGGALASVYHERRSQAFLKIWLAVFKAEADRLDEAWPDLRHAIAELGDDPILGLICEAASVRLLAHQGERDEVLRRAEELLSRIDALLPDLNTRRDVLDLLARALFQVGDYERSERCWERFLAATPHPIGEPPAYYYIGECRWHRNDPAGALDAFRRATAPGIDAHFAHLAERRARELSSSHQASV